MIDNFTRVSEILSLIKDYSFVKPDVLRAKQIIGTNVHEAIEKYYKQEDRLLLSPIEEMYYDGFMDFATNLQYNPLIVEQRFYDKERMITGKVDLIIEKSDKQYIVDFKTTANADIRSWKLQGGFYYQLAKEYHDLEPVVRIIHLKKNGSFTEYPLEITNEVIKECNSLYDLYRMLHNS
jgi:ATP-dependent exoDNAse (exonuclease V) beta subunit